ncbi:periplakin [Thalassophryne amazonica]|uniref:periplakin n=1 Tax=Thalassophryne amazonica TaxID=390379 RepID=UPI001471966E|nr:periplakin [Thalassophryne amazonica]
MMKKRTKTSAVITQPKTTSSTSSSELSILIEKLQKNADKVEKNIYDVEQNLNKDVNKINEGKQPLYQDDTKKRILNSLDLLTGLDEDASNAKKLQHPQAEMIAQDMKQLRDRVNKLNEEHEHIYSVSRTKGKPSVNWGNIMDEKQETLSNKGFGQDLPSVENEVEEHNIFHSEVEALSPYISSGGDKEYVSGLQMKYNKLLANSSTRQKNLLTLRDYMQRCTNELYWMDQQAEERINYDYSDANLGYPARQREYENFISKCLESKEATITKLNDDGDKMIASNHPAKNVIEAHMEAVHADWKEYLNLLICEENHLKHMDEYHKFYKEARDTQDLQKHFDTEVSQKYNPEFRDVYQMEGLLAELDDQAKAVEHIDDRVSALQKRSLQVSPLKYRRAAPQKPLPVEALCEFDTDEGQIARGEKYTLLNANGSKWDVKDAAGHKITAPAVCFLIPPTDPEAVALADSLASQQKAVKQKISGSKTNLAKRYDELKKQSGSGTDKQEQQCRQLMAGLDRVINDTDKQKKSLYGVIRPPLEQNRPLQDTADRMQDLNDIAASVKKLEPEKTSKVQEAKTFLTSNANSSSAPQLHSKVEETKRKYDYLEQLVQCSQEKMKNSHQLETSLQNSKNFISTYENKLAREDVAPSDLQSLQKTQRDLADVASDLRSKRSLIPEMEQSLRSAKNTCNNMATKFHEHCPDIERQEADVQKLSKRYNNLTKQTDSRSQSLQRASMAYSKYRNDYDDLNSWLGRIPNYDPQETDDLRQIQTKLNNQKNLVADIKRKESDLNNLSRNSQLYQQAVRDYENEAQRFQAILDVNDGLVPQSYKSNKVISPAQIVKAEEAAIEGRYTEVQALNNQKLNNLELTSNLLSQAPDVPLVQSTNVQSVHSAFQEDEPWRIRKQLEDEIHRRELLEKEIESIQTEIYILEGEKPQDTLVKKELIKKVPDPQLDEEIHKVQQRLSEERRTTQTLENDLEVLKVKLYSLETEAKEGAQQYVVKEVLRIEKDRNQEEEVRKLREELEELRRQKSIKDNELVEIQKRVTILAAEKSREQEVIKEEEVIKVQNDPQLETEYRLLLEKKQKEMDTRKGLEDELAFLQQRLLKLEKDKEIAEEKVTVREVLKVEKDVALEKEVDNLRRQYEDEKAKQRSSQRDRSDLQRKISTLEEEKSKVVIQEKVREIVRPDPKAESDLANLRLELVEQQRRYVDAEHQLKLLNDELTMLRNRGPRVETKEIIKEVIKYKTDPQTERELERLRNEIVDKTHQIEKSEMETRQLQSEIERWKDTKPQVQTKEVLNEVLQYREDPKTKEEIETLKKKLADEQKKRLTLERERSEQEEKIRLRKLELAEVKETIVQQEVVKMEEDPVLKSECNTFLQNINNEQKQRDSLKSELYQLQRQKADLDLQLEELERERRARRDAELEIQRLRVRLNELEIRDRENREKVTLRQKVVLQQDPQQEKEHSILRLQLDEEKHKRSLLEKELNALIQQQLTLEKMDVRERVVRTEKVQVEKDPEAEIEIENLKQTLEDEKRRKRELDQELATLTSRLSDMEFSNTKTSKEMEYVRDESNRLQQENQRLQNEIRKLRSEIEITSQETRLITESAPKEHGSNLERRLELLQKELTELRAVTRQKDDEIEKLQKSVVAVRAKKEQRESHLRKSIVVIDPETGKEMRPEEAYKLGLIDWGMFVNLQSQECDWEEITVKGPRGESSVLHDRKSGKKFSIDDALRLGHISNHQLQQYINKEISIQEFGALVAGKK